jgi:hypothetical protein
MSNRTRIIAGVGRRRRAVPSRRHVGLGVQDAGIDIKRNETDLRGVVDEGDTRRAGVRVSSGSARTRDFS